MRLRILSLAAALIVPSAVGVSTTWAHEKDEKTAKLADLPAPARDGLLREAKGATILRVEIEKEKGRTLYEGVVKQGDKEIGIVVDAKGALVGRHAEKDEEEHEHKH
jgi:uncharacterized membrane protein YkoI